MTARVVEGPLAPSTLDILLGVRDRLAQAATIARLEAVMFRNAGDYATARAVEIADAGLAAGLRALDDRIAALRGE